MKTKKLLIFSILSFFLVACGHDIVSEQPATEYNPSDLDEYKEEYNVSNLDDDSYYYQNEMNDYLYDVHPIIGTWQLISFNEYNPDGEFVADLIELVTSQGQDDNLLLPVVIRADGTVNWFGREYEWGMRDGMFGVSMDLGGYYSFENGMLVIERHYWINTSRQIFERVE